MELWDKTTLGRTGLRTSRLGLASSYGLGEADVVRAAERGINYLYWGSMRKKPFGRGVARVAKQKREDVVVVVQSYTRAACLMRSSLERALRQLEIEYADLLLLGWWNVPPPTRILDAANALVAMGKAKHVMISCHHRPTFEELAKDPKVGAIMVRYNAAHPGAESEVFPVLGASPPGVVAYTATRWGSLLNQALTPAGEKTPTSTDCYRFALSQPAVDVCLAGPRNGADLDQALAALDQGPLGPEELAWMKRVGKVVRSASQGGNAPVQLLDRLFAPKPKPLPAAEISQEDRKVGRPEGPNP